MTALIEAFRNRIRGETRLRLAVILGLTGMALILLSGLIHKSPKQTAIPEAETMQVQTADGYRAALEERLATLLSQLEGVGQVTVMVTLQGSAEQVYAKEVKTSENEHGIKQEVAFVLTRSSGNEAALVSETKYPAILGVAVLCTGGEHAAVRERVAKAVSALLGIPTSQLYVGKAISPS